MSKIRKPIKSMVIPQMSSEDGGMRWSRSISLPGMDYLDPVLLFDQFQRTEDFEKYYQKTQKRYVGMQMITYLVGGKYHYRSAKKEMGTLLSGSLLWVKSAAGVGLEEVFEKDQNLLEGFQIWINLPSDQKNAESEFVQVNYAQIPIVRQNDGSAIRVLIGNFHHAQSPLVLTQPKINLFELIIPPYASFSLDCPFDTSMVYLFQGRGHFGVYGDQEDVVVTRQKLLIYGKGDYILVRTEETPLRMLYLSGEPIREPVTRYGSFVMNQPDEINRYFPKT